jgi:hypothetical protein
MGSAVQGANMRDSQSIRDRFFLNYLTGDLHKAIGSPIDTGQANNNVFAAVARHYAVGSVDDLHVMGPDGMHCGRFVRMIIPIAGRGMCGVLWCGFRLSGGLVRR